MTDNAGLVASKVQRSPGDSAAVGPVLDALHGFAGDLYGQLSRTPGNLASTPYSVAVALGMTVNGASDRLPMRCARCCGSRVRWRSRRSTAV